MKCPSCQSTDLKAGKLQGGPAHTVFFYPADATFFSLRHQGVILTAFLCGGCGLASAWDTSRVEGAR